MGLNIAYSAPNSTPNERVMAFDGTKNGSIQTAYAGTSITQYDVDIKNGIVAQTFSDSIAYKLQIGTISGTSITWGSAITISGPAARVCVALKGDGTRVLVMYANTGGTNDYIIKSYSISGTTPTLDQTLTAATGTSSTAARYNITYMTSGRYVAFYQAATTQYPTALGINDAAGSLTKDGAAVTVQSVAATNNGMYIDAATTVKAFIGWDNSTSPRYAPITDNGTSLSAGTVVALQGGAAAISGYHFFAAGAAAYCDLSNITGAGTNVNTGLISSGAVSSEQTSTGAFSTSNVNARTATQNLTYLGDIDGDTKAYWFLISIGDGTSPYVISSTAQYLEFIGVFGTDANAVITVTKKVGTVLTNNNTFPITAPINTTSFVLLFTDTSNNIISLVCVL